MSDSKDQNQGGDTFTFGDLNNVTGLGAGRNVSVSVNQGGGSAELVQAFAGIYKAIHASNEDQAIKDVLSQNVKNIEVEASKGDNADSSKIEGWLKVIGRMAPDILEVTANTLMSPIGGVATVIKKIAEKAKAGVTNS